MAWVKSLLADYPGTLDVAWLEPAITVEDFLSPFVRHAKTFGQPKIRGEYQNAIAADRQLIDATLQPGDYLHPWCNGPQQVGIAVVREGQVVKAWLSAKLI